MDGTVREFLNKSNHFKPKYLESFLKKWLNILKHLLNAECFSERETTDSSIISKIKSFVLFLKRWRKKTFNRLGKILFKRDLMIRTLYLQIILNDTLNIHSLKRNIMNKILKIFFSSECLNIYIQCIYI